MKPRLTRIVIRSLGLAGFVFALTASAQIVRFRPKVGEALEVWRLTHDPAVRDYHNYHNTQCWSPDGRHLAFTRYAADEREYGTDRAAEIHLFDLRDAKDILVERGLNPRWANRHPWLLYNRLRPDEGARNDRGVQVVKLDVVSGRRTAIGHGLGRPTHVSHDDRFLYGIWYPANSRSGDAWEPYAGEPKAARLELREGAALEFLSTTWGIGYNSLLVNPAHPAIVSRDHHFRTNFFATRGTTDIPFKARHFVDHGPTGENATRPFPCMDGAHFAWSGDGEYFLPGNGPLRGRRWNEPFPANLHFLANIAVGDIGPAGRSGRWLVGSTGGGNGPIRVADLRSGEGWIVMPTHSFLCSPSGRDGGIELIPGENHWETRGYRVLRNGENVHETLLTPGTARPVSAPGVYTAVAVEWSGLESAPSLPLTVSASSTLTALVDAPADFRWTTERWVAGYGQSLSRPDAVRAAEAWCETVHLHDGVIHRQTWRSGRLERQDDLNGNGKPIRRLTYENGRLARREFLDAAGNLVSTEEFDADGFITHSAGQRSYSQGQPAWKRDGATVFAEWFYERGVPVRYTRGPAGLVKQGDRWVAAK